MRYDKWTRSTASSDTCSTRTPFSYYRLAAEYRFVGEQVPGGPAWAIRNNGLMLHSQHPQTMLKDQDFPISIEVQLLGGLSERQAAHDRQPLHARHERRHERQAAHGALHQLDVEDL